MSENENHCPECPECDVPEGWGWLTPEMMDEMDAANV